MLPVESRRLEVRLHGARQVGDEAGTIMGHLHS